MVVLVVVVVVVNDGKCGHGDTLSFSSLAFHTFPSPLASKSFFLFLSILY